MTVPEYFRRDQADGVTPRTCQKTVLLLTILFEREANARNTRASRLIQRKFRYLGRPSIALPPQEFTKTGMLLLGTKVSWMSLEK
jgi:hypothetical protein